MKPLIDQQGTPVPRQSTGIDQGTAGFLSMIEVLCACYRATTAIQLRDIEREIGTRM